MTNSTEFIGRALDRTMALASTGDSAEGLPDHHANAITTLLHDSERSSFEDSDEDDMSFFGLCDPEAMHQFLGACDYLFDTPDSDEEDWDPSLECFMMEAEVEELPEGGGENHSELHPPPPG